MKFNLAFYDTPYKPIINNTSPLFISCCGYYKFSISTYRPNGLKDYQILFVASGKLHVELNGIDKTFEKGNMILFRPDMRQNYWYFEEEKPEIYWLHFCGYEAEKLLAECEIPKNRFCFFIGTHPEYKALFNQMILELQLKRVNFESILSVLLKQFFLLVNRYLSERKNTGESVIIEIERAIRYFNTNYNRPINIKKYAEECNMSDCWFINNFKKITNLTPAQYLISLRINNAIELISHSNYNISQIANAVGYDNPLYFSRLFHKRTGMSPSEYKKHISNN